MIWFRMWSYLKSQSSQHSSEEQKLEEIKLLVAHTCTHNEDTQSQEL
jgi:hypothetical protein